MLSGMATASNCRSGYVKVPLEDPVMAARAATQMEQRARRFRCGALDQGDAARDFVFVRCRIRQQVFGPGQLVVCDPG